MEQNLAWGANSFWPSQEISHVYPIRWFFTLLTRPWQLSCPERDQSSPRLLFYFLKIHSIIFLPSTSVASKWSSFLRYPCQNFCTPLFSPHMQRAYVQHERTNVRHLKSMCCVYSKDPPFENFCQFSRNFVLIFVIWGHANFIIDDRLLQMHLSCDKILQVHGAVW